MDHRQHQTPLFSQLQMYAEQNPLPFHIPGHKKGLGMDPTFRAFLGENALSIDLINIPPLDNLHQPQHILHEAQTLAASAFGAKRSFFSVQGTTTSIVTMILATCQPGDQIILPRNIHQSVVTALILAGVHPLFLPSTSPSYLNITDVPQLTHIDEMLQKYSAQALFLIHPTYLGTTSELPAIVELSHRYQVPVLVDEAHGVLNYFHPELPISAMQAGADLAATSLHKCGGSLTQTSILHHQGDRIDSEHVQRLSSMLTTTSTSYVLLASIDTARRHLALHGEQLATQMIRLAQEAQQKITEIPGLQCTRQEDPSKLVIGLIQLKIDGIEAANWLRTKHLIEVELSEADHILCMITIGDTPETIAQLIDGLTDLANTYYDPFLSDQKKKKWSTLPLPELVLSPREAFYRSHKKVGIDQSIGQISGQTIMIYPPGVPILLPGEKIRTEHVAYLKSQLANKQMIQGLDSQHQQIQIIA